jgi:uncharacterized protein (TIGR00288 family)
MAASPESVSMALFCDFENVALGVRDSKYEKFDIKPVLERLLLKGSIVVKKAYCDWDRYKGFKATMHEASFELIEIPHVRQSGKNSADIRLVVDALDLCYTKAHVDTFVIISGDSDFSPLVSKLRENAKKVIGVGVKNSTSDLLVANCDEFIFYDDLVREQQRAMAKRDAREAKRAPSEDNKPPKQDPDARKSQAIAFAVETFEALASERGESGKIWASVLKSAIKRRKPGFSEAQYGFRAFGNLLDEAQSRGLLEVGRDEKNGAFVFRAGSVAASAEVKVEPQTFEATEPEAVAESNKAESNGKAGRRDKRGGRAGHKPRDTRDAPVEHAEHVEMDAPLQHEPPTAIEYAQAASQVESVETAPAPMPEAKPEPKSKPARRARKTSKKAAADLPQTSLAFEPATDAQTHHEAASAENGEQAAAQPARKPARKRTARARKASAQES